MNNIKYITIKSEDIEKVWEELDYCFVKMVNEDIYICPIYTMGEKLFGNIPLYRTAEDVSNLIHSKSSTQFALPFIFKDEGGDVYGR